MNLKYVAGVVMICGLIGCANKKTALVSNDFIDSLIKNYKEPPIARSNENALRFWKDRIHPGLPGIVSESKYAACLAMRFHLFGDILDIKQADSVIRKIDSDFNYKEAQANLTLVSYSILQHRFSEADGWLEKARHCGLKKYDLLTASFDVDFELGRYFQASNSLKQLKNSDDYGYFFRRSKMDHLNGSLDSAVTAMMKAANIEEGSAWLEEIALANAADLYIHAGDLKKAAELYIKCIRMNSADFHSIQSLGWIALVHDKNDSLAEKIFSFVQTKNKLPDAWYKLTQMAELRGDRDLAIKYAKEFASRASDTVYGNMYNKYLIELYTGILNNYSRAEQIAKRELDNRSTPQTRAWYAWALFCNNRKKEALDQYENHVSGKPLEALELYWMGKLMQGINKGYNAQAFFSAAVINKYDLSPAILNDLQKNSD